MLTVPTKEHEITAAVERMKRSTSYRDAEKRLGLVAVVMIASRVPLPRFDEDGAADQFSHNERGWHVSIGVAQDPDSYAADISAMQYQVPTSVVAHVWVGSKAHGARIKARIDTALGGRDDENWVRNRWYWISAERDLRQAWEVLLADALAEIELGGEYVETLSDKGKFDRVFQESRRRAR